MTIPSTSQILEGGAVVIVISGIVGGFMAGFFGRKSSDTGAANETITLINNARKALEEQIGSQNKVIEEQGKRIKDLEEVNGGYIKLFQGNPSRLEKYMADTAQFMKDAATSMAGILTIVQAIPQHTAAPATTTVNVSPGIVPKAI